jgi:hypothetical protein
MKLVYSVSQFYSQQLGAKLTLEWEKYVLQIILKRRQF